MKKHHDRKPLALDAETVRVLHPDALRDVAAGRAPRPDGKVTSAVCNG